MGTLYEIGFCDIPSPLITGWIDPARRWEFGSPIPVLAAELCGWDGTGAGRGGSSLPAALAVGQGRAAPCAFASPRSQTALAEPSFESTGSSCPEHVRAHTAPCAGTGDGYWGAGRGRGWWALRARSVSCFPMGRPQSGSEVSLGLLGGVWRCQHPSMAVSILLLRPAARAAP